MQGKAYLILTVSCMTIVQKQKQKRKRAQALFNSEQFSTFKKSFQLFSVLALEEILNIN